VKVGDLVRDKRTKAANTVGVVVDITSHDVNPMHSGVQVLIDGRIHYWAETRLEVISESR